MKDKNKNITELKKEKYDIDRNKKATRFLIFSFNFKEISPQKQAKPSSNSFHTISYIT